MDLNADHLAACVLDSSGNPLGQPVFIPMQTTGLPASQRDGRVCASITALLDHAEHPPCAAIVVENLDFANAPATGRETLGRGSRGKHLRHTVTGIPTSKFRSRLTAMATRRGIAVIGVDAAYTSRWANQHWKLPLQQQTSDPVTRHHAAAVAIGRRGLGLAIGDGRTPHRTADRGGHTTGQAPSPSEPRWQARQFRPTARTRCASVHRRTPARRGQHRSGRTQAGLTPAHS